MRLADWTKPEIDAACSAAHGRYDRALALQYTEYFAANPGLKGDHRHCAKSIETALPPDWGRLAERIPVSQRHRHHLSGKSSQMLALGLLGAASELSPTLDWLWKLLGVDHNLTSTEQRVDFEYDVEPTLLNEQPRVTSIDCLVRNSEMFVAIETKWAEKGLGSCSCSDGEGDATIGECADRILQRPEYMAVARDFFGLPPRSQGNYCPISTPYQAIRNVAAVRALAGKRASAFVLIFDENNPYFRECGDWPGWPSLLQSTLLRRKNFLFQAISWQRLLSFISLDGSVKAWAREKHRLSE